MLGRRTFVLLGESARDPSVPSSGAARRRRRGARGRPARARRSPSPRSRTTTTLTVRFVDAVALLPVDRAAVHVTAHQDGAVIDEVDGETDAAGVVGADRACRTRPASGGPVTLDVVAHKNTTFTDAATGCTVTDTWDASRLAVPVDGVELTVEFTADEQQAVSSIECPPEVAPPTGEVGGAVGTPAATSRRRCRRPTPSRATTAPAPVRWP